MSKFDETIKELKADIKDLENALLEKTDGLDDETKKKAKEFVDNAKKVINNAIKKVSDVIDNIKDDEQLDDLLDKIKAKSKEAVDFTIEKIETLINSEPKSDVDSLHDDIMAEFDKLKETDIYKTTTVLIKEGYAKLNEFLDKPEVKQTISKAKKTTISLAEKGVEGLKKVLVVDETPKKKKATTKKPATKKKVAAKKTTKKKATK